MDEHTRYEVDQVIGRETSRNVVKGFVNGWVSTFGPMRLLGLAWPVPPPARMKDFCTAYKSKFQLLEGAGA